MGRLSLWPAVLGVAFATIVVNVINPTPNSLAYASGGVVLLGLLGWVLEARAIAGPAPEVEPEHEEEEEAPGPSYWPIVLALGVVGIAAGLIYDFDHGALIAAVPIAAFAAAMWGLTIKEEMIPATVAVAAPEEALVGRAVTVGGRVFTPVAPRALAAQAAGGAAIAIETVDAYPISRRGILRLTFWIGLGAGVAALAGVLVDMLYPRGITGFGGIISVGTTDQFAPGSKTSVQSGKLWLVNLTAEQGGPGILALYWKCPHLGCTVPWRDTFVFVDPTTNQEKKGWFRCPCHGSTYNDAGVRVFGPAPRSMDHMDVQIDPASKRISINTGKITKGSPDNPKFAVKV